MKFYYFVQQNKLLLHFFHRLAFDISTPNNLFLNFIDSVWGLCGIVYTQLTGLWVEGETVELDKEIDTFDINQSSMFLNGTPFLADAPSLCAIIIEKTGGRRDIPISFVVDGHTRHAMVATSMYTISQLGFKRRSISTQRPAAGG